MPDQARVLHVVTTMGFGGVEVWLIALLKHMRALQDQGIETERFHILMTGGEKAELDAVAESLGATLHYIRFSRKDFAEFRSQFRDLLEREKFTAIHDHQDYWGAWRLAAGAGMLPPLRIVHAHNSPILLRVNTDTPVKKVLFQVARRVVQSLATHILGTSSQLLEQYGFTAGSFPRQTIRSLHCGFDVESFAASHRDANESVCDEFGWPQGSKLTLFVGRLDGVDPKNPAWNLKNPEFALEVARAAIESGADVRLILVGSGDAMRAELEKRVAAWGLSDRIRLIGKRDDVPRLMAASHAFLFPSMEEGLGMVAVEAQAAGLRVLASDAVPREAAAIPEQMTFMSLQETPSAWASRLTALLSMPRCDSRASAALVAQTDFSIERSYGQLHAIYSQS